MLNAMQYVQYRTRGARCVALLIIHEANELTLRSYLEAVARHAQTILVDQTGALLLGIVGRGEEHALVALCFLVGAYTARLCACQSGVAEGEVEEEHAP